VHIQKHSDSVFASGLGERAVAGMLHSIVKKLNNDRIVPKISINLIFKPPFFLVSLHTGIRPVLVQIEAALKNEG
jgi:hypothetical protein